MTQVHILLPHPANPPAYVNKIQVGVERVAAGELMLRFRLMGDLNMLQLTRPKEEKHRERRDELWRTTCFECFCRPVSTNPYFEINLAPSGDWAAYQFDRYRNGMSQAVAESTNYRASAVDGGCEVSARFTLPELAGGAWAVSLSAVVEGIDGSKSYWALAHPPGAPDFHHPACFTARLPAVGGA